MLTVFCVVLIFLSIRRFDTGVPSSDLSNPNDTESGLQTKIFSSAVCFNQTSVALAAVVIVFGVVVPLVAILISYSIIFCVVRSQMRRIAPPSGLSTTIGDDTRAANTWTTSASGSRHSVSSVVNSEVRNCVQLIGIADLYCWQWTELHTATC